MHLSNDNLYTTKYILLIPNFLSLLSVLLIYVYRRKNGFKKQSDLVLQNTLGLYFIYISNFYVLTVVNKTNIFFNKLVLYSLPIIIVVLLVTIELCSNLRKDS